MTFIVGKECGERSTKEIRVLPRATTRARTRIGIIGGEKMICENE